MKLLLDTCAFLWLAADDARLTAAASRNRTAADPGALPVSAGATLRWVSFRTRREVVQIEGVALDVFASGEAI